MLSVRQFCITFWLPGRVDWLATCFIDQLSWTDSTWISTFFSFSVIITFRRISCTSDQLGRSRVNFWFPSCHIWMIVIFSDFSLVSNCKKAHWHERSIPIQGNIQKEVKEERATHCLFAAVTNMLIGDPHFNVDHHYHLPLNIVAVVVVTACSWHVNEFHSDQRQWMNECCVFVALVLAYFVFLFLFWLRASFLKHLSTTAIIISRDGSNTHIFTCSIQRRCATKSSFLRLVEVVDG